MNLVYLRWLKQGNGNLLYQGLFFFVLLFVFDGTHAYADDNTAGVAGKVICNVVSFVQKLGLPIMTGVILGSSIMAVFGRLAWPAIAALVVFTAIFFGADKLISKFAAGAGDGADRFTCKDYQLAANTNTTPTPPQNSVVNPPTR